MMTTNTQSQPAHDLIITGAGPAGLMAAISAAEEGKSVLVLEKMDRPGRKLQITGKGRCNLTNAAPIEDFLPHFGKGGRFIKRALYAFTNQDLMQFFHRAGVETKTERGNRVFPASNHAEDIVKALVRTVQHYRAEIKTNTKVVEITKKPEQDFVITTICNEVLHKQSAKNILIAAGGVSYPGTGSTGDGYQLARKFGHTVIPPSPALVPLEVLEKRDAKRLQGLSLKNVEAALWIENRKAKSEMGEMLFTHFGLSGPIILTLSKTAVAALKQKKQVEIRIDLKPALDHAKLDARLQRELNSNGKKYFKSILPGLLPQKMIPLCIDKVNIESEKRCCEIDAEERKRLRNWLKEFRFIITRNRSLNEAIVTDGGVSLREINPNTLESRIVPGLFFAGEVMDIQAYTGGFNLQAAFSTGWVAGKSIH